MIAKISFSVGSKTYTKGVEVPEEVAARYKHLCEAGTPIEEKKEEIFGQVPLKVTEKVKKKKSD